MKFTHIHAKRGEHVVVHRHHHPAHHPQHAANSSDSSEWFIVIAIIAGFALIAAFWKIIITVLLIGAALWLIWLFRKPLASFLCATVLFIGKIAQHSWHKLQTFYHQRKSGEIEPEIVEDPADYGKIHQHRW